MYHNHGHPYYSNDGLPGQYGHYDNGVEYPAAVQLETGYIHCPQAEGAPDEQGTMSYDAFLATQSAIVNLGFPLSYPDVSYHYDDETHEGNSAPQPVSLAWHNTTPESYTSEHVWIEIPNMTPDALKPFIVELPYEGVYRFLCGWYGCSRSERLFKKVNLINHIKSVHLSEKPFVCITCDALFARKQDVVRHVTTMNNRKRFKCGFCERGFTRRYYRDRHHDNCGYRGLTVS